MRETELKPCPFCGGEARRYIGNLDLHGIVCKKCGAKIYGRANKASAARAWNGRIGFDGIAEKMVAIGYRKQSEEGAECPTCYGTGRIGTTNWLTKNMTKKQIAEEKAKAIAEHELHIKQDYAREIFEEICSVEHEGGFVVLTARELAELEKKYTEEQNDTD